jgi:hypothetical protein
LVGGYRKLPKSPGSAEFVNAKEVMTWTEANSLVPVIGMNTFNSDEGAKTGKNIASVSIIDLNAKQSIL